MHKHSLTTAAMPLTSSGGGVSEVIVVVGESLIAISLSGGEHNKELMVIQVYTVLVCLRYSLIQTNRSEPTCMS